MYKSHVYILIHVQNSAIAKFPAYIYQTVSSYYRTYIDKINKIICNLKMWMWNPDSRPNPSSYRFKVQIRFCFTKIYAPQNNLWPINALTFSCTVLADIVRNFWNSKNKIITLSLIKYRKSYIKNDETRFSN